MRRDRVAGTNVRLSGGNISGSRARGLVSVLSQQPGSLSALSTESRMIKLPIDSHLFSSSRKPRPARRQCGTQVLRPTAKREQPRAKLLAHRFISLSSQSPSLLEVTSPLVSPVRSRRSRNPTFKHAYRFRLMRTNCASLYRTYI